MKTIFILIALLATFAFANAATGLQLSDTKRLQTRAVSKPADDTLLDSPTLLTRSNASSVFSKTEAEVLRTQEDKLLATSNMDGIKVGNVGNNDLVYILVVVLLVVLIISVI